jgi:hypothetical protein
VSIPSSTQTPNTHIYKSTTPKQEGILGIPLAELELAKQGFNDEAAIADDVCTDAFSVPTTPSGVSATIPAPVATPAPAAAVTP